MYVETRISNEPRLQQYFKNKAAVSCLHSVNDASKLFGGQS